MSVRALKELEKLSRYSASKSAFLEELILAAAKAPAELTLAQVSPQTAHQICPLHSILQFAMKNLLNP